MDHRTTAERLGIPVLDDVLKCPLIEQRIALIPYSLAKQKKVIPIEETTKGISVAMADPFDLEAISELRLILKKSIAPIFVPSSAIEIAIERCFRQKEEDTKRFFSELDKEKRADLEGEDTYDLLEQSHENPIIRMVHALMIEAIQQEASDIHFEPTEEGLSIRYRIDGILHKKHEPPREYQMQILTRLKVMAKMDIAEHRLPQDGRVKLRYGGREIDFRVSTLPVVHGERIVIRILDRGNVLLGLEQIGMSEMMLQDFRKLIGRPEGIVLVTGPTGSGKTTTLYSAIAEINHSDVNILTIEDPVEYKIGGISQMNVNPRIDLSFAKGLRHILRQDPDVIMIGEIRDKETAEIAIQASLTGHLVFSTLHTNDAPSALTRLCDMGIEPYLLASSIIGVIAQRLVRKICPHCKTPYTPLPEELMELGIHRSSLLDGVLYKGRGCLACFGSGYKGRIAIYELMEMGSKIKTQVLKSQDAEELRKIALAQGMRSLFDYGSDLIVRGLTTGFEVLRVTRMGEEREYASL